MHRNLQVVYVYSGKGGVGKSTVCVNLAYAFSLKGKKTAIFDADLSGPSLPTFVSKIEEQPPLMEGVTITPGIYGGVKINSLGFISKPIDGAFWTGKYLQGALYQLVLSVSWDVDILLIDLPPGTSEIHREMLRMLPGKVIIVTTPQELSYADIVRSFDFLKRLNTEILGIVENMSYYDCKSCNTRVCLFVGDTESKICNQLDVKLLCELPFDPEISLISNSGIPYILVMQKSSVASEFMKLADKVSKSYTYEGD